MRLLHGQNLFISRATLHDEVGQMAKNPRSSTQDGADRYIARVLAMPKLAREREAALARAFQRGDHAAGNAGADRQPPARGPARAALPVLRASAVGVDCPGQPRPRAGAADLRPRARRALRQLCECLDPRGDARVGAPVAQHGRRRPRRLQPQVHVRATARARPARGAPRRRGDGLSLFGRALPHAPASDRRHVAADGAVRRSARDARRRRRLRTPAARSARRR